MTKKKTMYFLKLTICLAISICGITAFQEKYDTNKDVLDKEVCLTPGCVVAAADIIKNMDTETNPCDDFYRFACGKFLKETEVPDDTVSVNSFTTIADKVNENLKTLLEQQSNPEEPKPFSLLKQLYKTCMNVDIEENSLAYFKEILKNLGGWPVLEGDNWNEGIFDWKESVYNLRKLGLDSNYFIKFEVESDPKNSTRRVITLDQPSLAVPQEVLVNGNTNSKVINTYYDYMVEVAMIFGASKEVALKELKESLKFEIKLAQISLPIVKWFNATALYNPLPIQELGQRYPGIDWKQYINNVLNIPDIKVDDKEIVIVNVPQYMGGLEKLLKITPKRVLSNYVIWRTVHFSVPYLTEQLKNKKFQLDAVLNGISVDMSRSEECVTVVAEKMALATSALYIRNYFNNEIRENVKTMVTDVRSAFKETLEKLDWMDEVTRNNSLEKLASIVPNIAYSDDMVDDKKLENYYSSVGVDIQIELNATNYLTSILNLSLFDINELYKKLRHSVDRKEWDMYNPPTTVDAFYIPWKNVIMAPAGILQGVFFSNDRPQYLNYGGIGFVIGHEITHNFDNFGRHYDEEGNLADWWTEDTNDDFLTKAKCMIDQYNNYSISEHKLNVNGELTLNENIADNGGIKEAYLAYEAWVKRNGAESGLPGLNYTSKQLFWISFANVLCTMTRPEYFELFVLTNDHSPAEFRVRGPLSNSEYFSNDFNCPLGTKMNPVHKCHIW